MKFVVIGSSAAGINAVEVLRRLRPEATIDLISEENAPLYSRSLLSFYLAGQLPETKLLYRPNNFYQQYDIRAHVGARAIRIDPSSKQVHLASGEKIAYDSLLIATGARSKMPQIPGIELDGIYPLRDLKDAHAIKKRLKQAPKAAILGGGLVGLKAAQALKNCGLKVTVVVKSGRLLSQMLDTEAAKIFESCLQQHHIDLIPGKEAVAFQGRHSVEKIILDDGSSLDTNLVIIGKGVKPNTELLPESAQKSHYGIPVNHFLQTNVEHLYAAGDVVETNDLARGEKRINALWPCAVEQGRIAATNMAGKPTAYAGSMSMNSLQFFNIPVISMGIVSAQAPEFKEI
ncbi:NAD(P)/FAD-dependent oxidoreductase, partial [candidate division CSSED10-310 bacterium]